MATELPLLTGPFVYLICAAFGGPGGPRLPLYTLPSNSEQTKFFVQESSPEPRARPSPRPDSGPVPSRAPGAPGRGQEPERSFLPPSTHHPPPPRPPLFLSTPKPSGLLVVPLAPSRNTQGADQPRTQGRFRHRPRRGRKGRLSFCNSGLPGQQFFQR